MKTLDKIVDEVMSEKGFEPLGYVAPGTPDGYCRSYKHYTGRIGLFALSTAEIEMNPPASLMQLIKQRIDQAELAHC